MGLYWQGKGLDHAQHKLWHKGQASSSCRDSIHCQESLDETECIGSENIFRITGESIMLELAYKFMCCVVVGYLALGCLSFVLNAIFYEDGK